MSSRILSTLLTMALLMATMLHLQILLPHYLSQLVTSHTHIKNNILDLVIIPKTNTFSITNLIISTLTTDQYSIHFKLNTAKYITKRVTILYKKLSNVDHDLFQNEFLASSDLETITPDYFNKLLTNLLNLHALEIIYLPNAPWFNSSLSSIKRSYRKAEKNIILTNFMTIIII